MVNRHLWNDNDQASRPMLLALFPLRIWSVFSGQNGEPWASPKAGTVGVHDSEISPMCCGCSIGATVCWRGLGSCVLSGLGSLLLTGPCPAAAPSWTLPWGKLWDTPISPPLSKEASADLWWSSGWSNDLHLFGKQIYMKKSPSSLRPPEGDKRCLE